MLEPLGVAEREAHLASVCEDFREGRIMRHHPRDRARRMKAQSELPRWCFVVHQLSCLFMGALAIWKVGDGNRGDSPLEPGFAHGGVSGVDVGSVRFALLFFWR